jgi:ABC-type transport system involved in multi-copper enzyme maturation permease subunit
VPSTRWTLIAAAALGVGIGALVSALSARHYAQESLSTRALWDPTSISGAGLDLAQLAIGVLGIMIITSEYSTGAIRTSLTAVPRRGRFLAAKALVIAGLTFAVSEITAFAAFFIGQALISGHAPTASLGQPQVLRALVGCGLYGALIGLLGLALGALLRHASAAIAVLVALVFILPAIAAALPASIEHNVEKFWPTQAGQQVTVVVRGADSLSPWAGLGYMCLFVGVVLAASFVLLNRHDA